MDLWLHGAHYHPFAYLSVVYEGRYEYQYHNTKISPISHLKSLAVGKRIENLQEVSCYTIFFVGFTSVVLNLKF